MVTPGDTGGNGGFEKPLPYGRGSDRALPRIESWLGQSPDRQGGVAYVRVAEAFWRAFFSLRGRRDLFFLASFGILMCLGGVAGLATGATGALTSLSSFFFFFFCSSAMNLLEVCGRPVWFGDSAAKTRQLLEPSGFG